ncbi:MAG: radical SAM protein [Prevotella sp.]|nr:radical SAM protein [Candidatus Prevotella equi]
MRVNEIFYSLQGEGHYTGTPAVFLRLSGCNMKCPFCDTQHTSFTEMTEEEIASHVSRFPARHIVITGGEPTMQLNAKLTALLHNEGFFIQIETNGSLPLQDGVSLDWITCSPKDAPIAIQRIDELKVLFMNQDMSQYDGIQAKEYRLQPLDSGNEKENAENLQQTINYILEHPKWNLSLQTHKIINVQ